MSDLKIRLEGCNSVDDAIELINSKFKGHYDYRIKPYVKDEKNVYISIYKNHGGRNSGATFMFGHLFEDNGGYNLEYNFDISPGVKTFHKIMKVFIIIFLLVSLLVGIIKMDYFFAVFGIVFCFIWYIFMKNILKLDFNDINEMKKIIEE